MSETLDGPNTSSTGHLFNLTGKRVLITGSTSGIGLELARGLASAGATIILNGRSQERLIEAALSLSDMGFSPEQSCFDVTDEGGIKDAIAGLTRQFPIDVLINNAGIQRRSTLESVELSMWNEVLATNLTGAMLTSREVVHGMRLRGAGKIINICSLMSEFGRKTTGPYTAAKGGLKMLTKAMCADWGRFNIQINAIGPGYFITKMTQTLAETPSFDSWVKQRTPAERWGTPNELLGAAIFLSTQASSFVNGQILYVDGGMSSVL
jgi:gluconate 5-dehydrogenase